MNLSTDALVAVVAVAVGLIVWLGAVVMGLWFTRRGK